MFRNSPAILGFVVLFLFASCSDSSPDQQDEGEIQTDASPAPQSAPDDLDPATSANLIHENLVTYNKIIESLSQEKALQGEGWYETYFRLVNQLQANGSAVPPDFMNAQLYFSDILRTYTESGDVSEQRIRLTELTEVMQSLLNNYPHLEEGPFYLLACEGKWEGGVGYWLSSKAENAPNPYLSDPKSECARVEATF